MAGDWLKIEMSLPDKPETCRLSDELHIDIDTVVGKLIRFWRWSNSHSVNGKDLGVTTAFIDLQTNCSGFAAALIKVGWLIDRNGRLSVPHFDRHNSQTAKARALTFDRVKRSRNGQRVTESLPEKRREEKTIGEPIASKGDRKAIGNSNGNGNGHSHSQSPVNKSLKTNRLDLSHVDWDHVICMSQNVARKIRPITERDRRAWFRYGVLAAVTFSENWLMDSVEAVLKASDRRRTPQAHLVGVLKAKAGDEGYDEITFNNMARAIEIPKEIWDSDILEVREK